MVAPTGVAAKSEINIPSTAHSTESAAEHIVTPKKLLQSRIAERAGKITNAEISNEPTKLRARDRKSVV